MTRFIREPRELGISEPREVSIGELDQVSGGDMLGMAINAAERAMTGLFGRLIEAVHRKA